MATPRRIVLTGRAGVGKSTAAEVLRQHFGLPVLNVGDALQRALTESGAQRVTRAEVGLVYLATHCVSDIFNVIRRSAERSQTVVIDGVRFVQTCQQIAQWDPDAQIWHVEAVEGKRLDRLTARFSGLSPEQRRHVVSTYSAYECDEQSVRAVAHLVLRNNYDFRVEFEQVVKDAYVSSAKPAW